MSRDYSPPSPCLYLLRHAQSGNNAKPDSERVCDPEITQLGHQQAEQVAKALAGNSFESLITSAFRRALQTADYLRKELDLSPEVVIDLHEHGGCYEGWHDGNFQGMPGMNPEQIRLEFGQVELPLSYPEAGWWESKPRESHENSDGRAAQMSNYLQRRLTMARLDLACVSHADFLSKLLAAMFGETIRSDERFADLKNVGVTKVYLEQGSWRLWEMNSVDFLPQQLVSS